MVSDYRSQDIRESDEQNSPPLPRTWRVMGLLESWKEFLVVMGTSREDCLARLPGALEDYTPDELRDVSSLWLEEWVYDDFFHRHAWHPQEELSMRSHRLRAAALRQHALRRSA